MKAFLFLALKLLIDIFKYKISKVFVKKYIYIIEKVYFSAVLFKIPPCIFLFFSCPLFFETYAPIEV